MSSYAILCIYMYVTVSSCSCLCWKYPLLYSNILRKPSKEIHALCKSNWLCSEYLPALQTSNIIQQSVFFYKLLMFITFWAYTCVQSFHFSLIERVNTCSNFYVDRGRTKVESLFWEQPMKLSMLMVKLNIQVL